MNVEKLRHFVFFIDRGAPYELSAQALNLTASGLFRSIKTLQDDVGCKLLETIGGHPVLTEAGHRFYEHAKDIIAKTDLALESVRQGQNDLSGSLKISTTVAIATLLMVDDIADFMKEHTSLTFSIVGTESPVDLIKAADVAVRPYIEGASDLEQIYLTTHQMKLYASQDYVDQYGAPSTLQELKNHRLIAYEESQSMPYTEVNWHLSLIEGIYLRPYLLINTGVGILKAVENGLGIGSISNLGVEGSRVPLVPILPDNSGADVRLFFHVHTAKKSYKKIQLFQHYLEQRFKAFQAPLVP